MPSAMADIETRYFDALERGDTNVISGYYSPQVRVWNTLTLRALTGTEHIESLEKHFFANYFDRKFTDHHVNHFVGGFVRQHILKARRASDDKLIELPICVVCKVDGGLLTRVDEYMNRIDR